MPAADADRDIASALDRWLRIAAPALIYGIRMWAAVCLALLVAFWLELDNAYWAGATAAAVCQPVLGASLRKAWFRLLGTIVGAVMAVLLTAAFPQDRASFLFGLALWSGVCALCATLLHNFASYGAALAGFTTAIIVGDELGSVGGVNGDAFNLAITRGTEIGIGIVCASVLLSLTDRGSAQRRLADRMIELSADIAGGLLEALRLSGPAQAKSRSRRRGMIRRIAGLDVLIDQASGEIGTVPLDRHALRAAAYALFGTLTAWRSVANHLEFATGAEAEAVKLWECLPPVLKDLSAVADPHVIRVASRTAAQRLLAFSTETPSLRFLCDRTAEGLLALRSVMGGVLALEDPISRRHGCGMARLSIPDVLPALINAVRAFLTVGAAAVIWIWTAWPSGATFLIFATIGTTLFAPREDAAYTSAQTFTIGTALAASCAAVAAFSLVPRQSSFTGLCVVLGLVLIPAGALSSQPWRQPLFAALGVNFIALLRPSNPPSYDPAQFYNSAIALLAGVGFAMLMLRLIPPVPPETRARRLQALALRDLRCLASDKPSVSQASWEGRMHGRLSAIPDTVNTLHAARLTAALSVGNEIIRLRCIARRFALGAELEPALTSIALGKSNVAIQEFHRLDCILATSPVDQAGAKSRLRARGTVRSVIDSLSRHASFFDAKVGP